jgi:hypothetical protein
LNGTIGRIAPDTIALGDAEPVIAGASAEPSDGSGTMLTVRGSGFAPKADVYIDGSLQETKRIDAGTLQAKLPESIRTGSHSVQVKLIDSKGFTLQTSNTWLTHIP